MFSQPLLKLEGDIILCGTSITDSIDVKLHVIYLFIFFVCVCVCVKFSQRVEKQSLS